MNWTVEDGHPDPLFNELLSIKIDGGKPSAISGGFGGDPEKIPDFLVAFSKENMPTKQYAGTLFREEEYYYPSDYKPGMVMFYDPSEKAYVPRKIAFEMAIAFGEGALERAGPLLESGKLPPEWPDEVRKGLELLRKKLEEEIAKEE